MRGRRFTLALAPALAAGCAGTPDRGTLGQLHSVEPDVAEVVVQDTLDLAIESSRRFLEETPTGPMTPEAMRRLADLELEKEFGITGDSDRWVELPAPETGVTPLDISNTAPATRATAIAAELESDADFERRATEEQRIAPAAEPA